MAQPNTPSEQESELSGHSTIGKAGHSAPLAIFMLAAAAAVTGIAKEADAQSGCGPQNFTIPIPGGSESVSGTVTPLQDGRLRADAQFSQRPNVPVALTFAPAESPRNNQAGLNLTVRGRDPHINHIVEGLGTPDTADDRLTLTTRQGNERTWGQVTMPLPRVCPPLDTHTEGMGSGRSGDQPPVAPPPVCDNNGTCDTPRETTANCRADCPPPPNPAEIFADSPPEFTVHARYELDADRSPGSPAGPALSPEAAFRRGDLRTIQFDPDQLPAPRGMDFTDQWIAPDGSDGLNSGLYVYVARSISGMGAPYNAVYRAHAAKSDQPQNLNFERIFPAQGSDFGSGGPQTLQMDVVISVRDGEFSMRPRVSSNLGATCDLVPQQPDEGVLGGAPVLAQCDLPGVRGHARYAGAMVINYSDLTNPEVIAALIRNRRIAIANREAPADAAAEGAEPQNVPMLLRRMRSLYAPLLPAGVYVLDALAIQHFMRPNYMPTNPAAPGSAPQPVTPVAPARPALPSSAPIPVAPPVSAAPAPSGMAVPPVLHRRASNRA